MAVISKPGISHWTWRRITVQFGIGGLLGSALFSSYLGLNPADAN